MSSEQLAEKAQKTAPKRPATLVTRLDKAKSVAVAGDFNDWSGKGTPMVKNGQGEWCLTFKLKPGEYQYRLLVDGEWRDHPEAEKRVPNPYGGHNCVLTVS